MTCLEAKNRDGRDWFGDEGEGEKEPGGEWVKAEKLNPD